MPFPQMLLIKYQADFLGSLSSCRGNLRPHKEMEFGRRKTMKAEFISQTVTYGSFMKRAN